MKRQATNCGGSNGKDKNPSKNRRKSSNTNEATVCSDRALDQKLKELDSEHLKKEGLSNNNNNPSPGLNDNHRSPGPTVFSKKYKNFDSQSSIHSS